MSPLVLILLIVLLFGGFGGGYYVGPGIHQYGGYGLGTVALVVLIVLLLRR